MLSLREFRILVHGPDKKKFTKFFSLGCILYKGESLLLVH